MKLLIAIVSLFVGLVAGCLGTMIWQQFHIDPTLLWIAESNFKTESGIFIPKGTQLNYVRGMPEGYHQAVLNLAIEGEAAQKFKSVSDERKNLKIQYFIARPEKVGN